MKKIFLSVAMAFLAANCTGSGQSGNSNDLPALPTSWIAGQPGNVNLETPSPAVVHSIQTAFQVHTNALEASVKPTAASSTSAAKPPDWVPWHLDGMIGSFVVDVGGVFGALVGDGDTGVRVTWQQQQSGQAAHTVSKHASYRFNANMTQQDVSAMLEPAVQMAVASHAVTNPSALRTNLVNQGMQFLSTVKILSSVPATPGWSISGFQLGLSFTATGQVNPLVGVGGNVTIYFDWDVAAAGSSQAPALTAHESVVEQNMAAFVQAVSSSVVQAASSATGLSAAGFAFQVFQVGLGITVSGDVGIASTQASAVGRILFASNSATAASSDAPAPQHVNRIANDTATPIDIGVFKAGVQRAIQMGTFFAQQAKAVETPSYKTSQIELGFDTDLGGTLNLITVQATGQIRIDFNRIN